MENQKECPYCGSERTTKKGLRRTKTIGVRIIRRCKACSRKYTVGHETETPAPGPTPVPEPNQIENQLAGPSG